MWSLWCLQGERSIIRSQFACLIANAGMLGSAYDTAANTAHSAVTTGAGLVEKTANYIGDTAAKYSK